MKHGIKTLGAVALAVMALAALTGGSAAGTTGGHFVSSVSHTQVKLTTVKGGQHSFTWVNSNGSVACGSVTHEGTIAATTVASIDLTPAWREGCVTGDGTPMVFTENGCTLRLTIASGTTATTEQTVDLVCPAGKVLELDQGGTCLVTMVPQIAGTAATYTTTEVNGGKHAITVDLNATFETQFHAGICVFLGTKQFTTLKGSGVLSGYDTTLQPVALTAT